MLYIYVILAYMFCIKRYCKFRMQPTYFRKMSRGRPYISFPVVHFSRHTPPLWPSYQVCVGLGSAKRELIEVESKTTHLIVSKVS